MLTPFHFIPVGIDTVIFGFPKVRFSKITVVKQCVIKVAIFERGFSKITIHEIGISEMVSHKLLFSQLEVYKHAAVDYATMKIGAESELIAFPER